MTACKSVDGSATANVPVDQSLYSALDPETSVRIPGESTPGQPPQDVKIVRMTVDDMPSEIKFLIDAKLLAERSRIRELNAVIRRLGGAD
ncbi:MAG: hypothetical protein KKE86_06105 [Planctomycetes bacterium]|nr:hypothetical protein [Planctomycetota bacterium]MBU4398894.1 hypothetical protein [Planctomycetota bacterium]MCG2683766.1 hypothetical protein [Planctomycetales bacterium]